MGYTEDPDILSTRYDLFDGLNEHGFLFEEKCASVLANNSSLTHWSLLSREFPVVVNNRDSRIDLLLRDNLSQEMTVYAVIECKRINPLLAHWLFGNPDRTAGYIPSFISLSSQHDRGGNYKTVYSLKQFPCSQLLCHTVDNWWLEQRSQEKKRVISPSPIEAVFLQAILNIAGLGRELELQWAKTFPKQNVLFIPIVITTAPLFIASYNVDDVDLTTGDIEASKVAFGPAGETAQQAKWLLVNYSASRSISPNGLYDTVKGYSPEELEQYYKRTIFVVNAEHIVEFFSRLHSD